MQSIHSALERSRFFEGIADESRAALARICRVLEFQKRRVVFNEGEDGVAVFILLEGDVQLHKVSPEGKEVVIKVIKPGEMFGEVILFERNAYPSPPPPPAAANCS